MVQLLPVASEIMARLQWLPGEIYWDLKFVFVIDHGRNNPADKPTPAKLPQKNQNGIGNRFYILCHTRNHLMERNFPKAPTTAANPAPKSSTN